MKTDVLPLEKAKENTPSPLPRKTRVYHAVLVGEPIILLAASLLLLIQALENLSIHPQTS